jgi:hypothetical protein
VFETAPVFNEGLHPSKEDATQAGTMFSLLYVSRPNTTQSVLEQNVNGFEQSKQLDAGTTDMT